MLILVKLIGLLIVAMGIIFLLSPKVLKQYIAFWKQGKKIYALGVLRLLIGVVFLLTASQCRLVGVILTLGILILLKGIAIFVLGLEKIKSMLDWWGRKSPLVFRLLSLVALAIGALILYSV